MTLKEILMECADMAGCTLEDIRGPSKNASIADARSEYCRRACSAGYSWSDLGRFIHRDSASAMLLAKRKPTKLRQKHFPF